MKHDLILRQIKKIIAEVKAHHFIYVDVEGVKIFIHTGKMEFEQLSKVAPSHSTYKTRIEKHCMDDINYTSVFLDPHFCDEAYLVAFINKVSPAYFYCNGFLVKEIVDGYCIGFSQKEMEKLSLNLYLIQASPEVNAIPSKALADLVDSDSRLKSLIKITNPNNN